MNYQERLAKVIPGGAHTYSRGADQFPANAPQILDRGKGAYVWDASGRKLLDYGMALRSVTLGYSYESVAEAAYQEILKGNNLTRASLTELEAAELLVDLIPSADMVKFAKNGSNVTTAAVKVARAFTGRKYVCIPRQHPFFSFDDWFIGTTAITRGVPSEHFNYTLTFDYGDIASLEKLFAEYPDQIACVMLEPATSQTPCSAAMCGELSYERLCRDCPNNFGNFLKKVQAICRKHSTLFILDEMITGFRWHLKGAQHFFGVDPDLTTFGKAMANGFSVAALVGKREIMDVGSINNPGSERTFLLSTTHGGEMSSLRAFIETVKVYETRDVCQHLWNYGQKLKQGMNKTAEGLGISEYFYLEGPPVALSYVTKDRSMSPSLAFRTLFSQEMIRSGVLMPWIATSLSHQEAELELTIQAAAQALKKYRMALEDGIASYLESDVVKPVFRRYN